MKRIFILSILVILKLTAYSQNGIVYTLSKDSLPNKTTTYIRFDQITIGTSGLTDTVINASFSLTSYLDIAMSGNTIYLLDNAGNLDTATLNPVAKTLTSKSNVAKFIYNAGKSYYGLTIDKNGIVYAACKNHILTYDITKPNSATNPKDLGAIDSTGTNKYTIAGDLLFYNNTLYSAEQLTSNGTPYSNYLIQIANPNSPTTSASQYLRFPDTVNGNVTGSVFGFASTTVPCKLNQPYALFTQTSTANLKVPYTYLLKVDMNGKTCSKNTTLILPFDVYDAASPAERLSSKPPTNPTIVTPLNYCVNNVALKDTLLSNYASLSNPNDQLRWYTNSTINPFSNTSPVQSTINPGTTNYYVSEFDPTNGCVSDTLNIVATVYPYPAKPSISPKNTVVLCASSDTLLTASLTTGQYQWYKDGVQLNGSTSQTLRTIGAGKYTVGVTNAGGCTTVSDTTTINILTPLSHLLMANNPITDSCGRTTGAVSYIESGSAGGYQYSWKGLDTTLPRLTSVSIPTIINVPGNKTYQLNVVDANGCKDSVSILIPKSFAPQLKVSTTKINCFGDAKDTAKIVVSNGTPTYTYTWNPSIGTITHSAKSDTIIASNLTAGTYLVNITDFYLCTNSIQFTITQPTKVAHLKADSSIPTCGSNNGVIKLTDTGGTKPYTYTWNPSVSNLNSTGDSAFKLSSGTYSIHFKDANGCGDTTYSIALNGSPVGVPTAKSVCVNKSIQLSSSTLLKNSNPSIAFVTTSGSAKGLVAGIDTITFLNTGGCIDTFILTVNPLPVVAATQGLNSICIGKTTTLTNNSTPTGVWNTLHSGIISISATGIVSALQAGTDSVLFSNTSTFGCSNSDTFKVTVNPLPIIAPIQGNTTICVSATTQLTSATPNGVWISANPSIASVSNSGLVTGIALGTDSVKYIVTNSNGCTDSLGVKITVNNGVNTPFISYTKDTICTTSTTTFTSSVSGGNWSSSNTSIASINPSNGLISGLTPGTSTITYSITGTCGNASATHNIVVNAAPAKPIISSKDTVCNNKTISFSTSATGGVWSSSNTSLATINAAGVVNGLASTGQVTITYTVSNSCGTNSATKQINLFDVPSVPSISGATSLCANTTSTLTPSVTGGIWTSSNTNVATINSSGLINPVKDGQTIITYTLSNSCGTTSNPKTITINPIPTISAIAGNDPICVGVTDNLVVTPTGGTWTSANPSNATVNSTNGLVTGVSIGNVLLTYAYTSAAGCSNTQTTTVSVVQLNIGVSNRTTSAIYKGQSVTLDAVVNAGKVDNWQWQPTGLFATQNLATQSYIADSSRTIKVIGLNNAGCTDTATIYVEVKKLGEVFVPNAFTPNGDGTNDVLKVYSYPLLKSMHFEIFTQWGERIFQSTNQSIGWDGRSGGKQQPVGVYVYVLQATLQDDSHITKKGSFTIVR